MCTILVFSITIIAIRQPRLLSDMAGKQRELQSNLDGSNTDGSFTMANSNSFLSPYEILPIAQENKYFRKFSYEDPAKSFVTGFGLLQCYVLLNVFLLQTFKVFPLY